MHILHVKIMAAYAPQIWNIGSIFAVKQVIAAAVDVARPEAVAVDEPFINERVVTLNFWIPALFGIDLAYTLAYLKAHLRHYREVLAQIITDEAVTEATFGKHPELTTEEILLLFRVVENKLSPECLTADGERPRSEVRRLEKKWQAERDLLVRLLKREPTFEELYPEIAGDVYQVSAGGSIVDRHGAVLYEADSIRDLSPAAKQRLAELHTAHPELEWEGCGDQIGASDILRQEGLLPDEVLAP
jgi:hypothetical protein